MYCIGIGSGSGESGASHASVQALLSMRHGLPVNDRERTVSRDPASSSCCFCAGGRSASSTVSHSDPAHTPCAPSASAAAICSPEPTPPAANIGVGAMALATWGHSTIEPTSPVWPPPSPPCAMTMSTPASLCFIAWYGDPQSAATLRPASWMWSMTSAGGVPSALAMRRTLGCASATSIWGIAVAEVQPSSRMRSSSSGGSSGTPCSARIRSANSTCALGTMARSCSASCSGSISSIPSYLPGITMSTP